MSDNNRTVCALIKRFYFFIALILLILAASVFRYNKGTNQSLRGWNSSSPLITCIIFFLTGLSIGKGEFTNRNDNCRKLKSTLYVQVLNFIVNPIIAHIFVSILTQFLNFDYWIGKGLIATTCLPPAIRSTIFISCKKGDEAAITINIIFGRFLGIFCTPLLLLLLVGLSTTIPIFKTIIALTRYALLPLLIGHICQEVFSHRINIEFIKHTHSLMMLFSIFVIYEDIFNVEMIISAQQVLMALYSAIALHTILLILIWNSCTLAIKEQQFFTRRETVVIMLCSTQKSIAIGFPLLRTLFVGYSHFFPMCITLFAYFTVQLIYGAIIGPVIYLRQNKSKMLLQSGTV